MFPKEIIPLLKLYGKALLEEGEITSDDFERSFEGVEDIYPDTEFDKRTLHIMRPDIKWLYDSFTGYGLEDPVWVKSKKIVVDQDLRILAHIVHHALDAVNEILKETDLDFSVELGNEYDLSFYDNLSPDKLMNVFGENTGRIFMLYKEGPEDEKSLKDAPPYILHCEKHRHIDGVANMQEGAVWLYARHGWGSPLLDHVAKHYAGHLLGCRYNHNEKGGPTDNRERCVMDGKTESTISDCEEPKHVLGMDERKFLADDGKYISTPYLCNPCRNAIIYRMAGVQQRTGVKLFKE